MGQAKIRKMKGDYPIVDRSDDAKIDKMLFQESMERSSLDEYGNSEDRRLARERRKPLPLNNSRYHFPIMTDNNCCLVFCMAFCDGDYEDHLEETVGLGEMAAHIIMCGHPVTFASSLDGEELLRQVMIPSCNHTLSRFGVLPTPNDYKVALSATDEEIKENAPSWVMRDSRVGQSFTIKDQFGAMRGLSYLAGVDACGEMAPYNEWKMFSELPQVKEAESQVKSLGVECAKHGFDAMLAMHNLLVDSCKDGKFGDPLTWRRMSRVIERQWDGIGDWLA